MTISEILAQLNDDRGAKIGLGVNSAVESFNDSLPLFSFDEAHTAIFDSSVGVTSGLAYIPVTKIPVRTKMEKDINNELVEREPEFLKYLLSADFKTEFENDATLFVDYYLQIAKAPFLTWLGDFYLHHQEEERVLLQLIALFQCYDYEELTPIAPMFSQICINKRDSLAVQSANLSLLGHWCNKEALRLIRGVEMPEDPWVRVKYERLTEITTALCTTSEP